MATRKMLADLDWVRLAASADPARPVLTGVHVNGHLEATDGHRLHRAPKSEAMTEGLWAKDGQAIDGTYPNCDMVIPRGPAHWRVADLGGMREIVEAAMAAAKWSGERYRHMVSVPCCANGSPTADGPAGAWASFVAAYMRDILRGADGAPDAEVALRCESPLRPLRVDIGTGAAVRTAVLMPVRVNPDGQRSARFDLGEFLDREREEG